MFKSRQFFNQIASLAEGLIFIPFVLNQWFALDCYFIHIMDGASGSYACTSDDLRLHFQGLHQKNKSHLFLS